MSYSHDGNNRFRHEGDSKVNKDFTDRPSVSRAQSTASSEPRGAEAYSRSKYGAQSNNRRRQATRATTMHSATSMSRAKKILIAVVVVLVLLAGSIFGYLRYINGNLHIGINDDLRAQLTKTDMNREPFYVLLLGVDKSSARNADEYYGGVFRSDSIMLVRVDPIQKQITLVSIHRDTLVDLGAEYGVQKINAAHAFGGPALSVQAVSQLAGVPISHYAEVDFDGFKEAVDAVGGVEVDVPVEINDSDAGGHLDAGLQTLNGDQALILCRSRHTYDDSSDPDSMRAANQRLVLSAIARKVLDSDVLTIANTVTAMSSYIMTDLSVSDIVGIAQNLQGLNPDTDIYTAMEPVISVYENDTWNTYNDIDQWKIMMSRVDQGLPPCEDALVDERTGTVLATAGNGADASATVKRGQISVKNGTSTSGLASEAASRLADANFVNVDTGNADSDTYTKTTIIYNDDKCEFEATLVQEALGCGEIQKNNGDYLFTSDVLIVIGSDWPSN